jgi:hypothetical protein
METDKYAAATALDIDVHVALFTKLTTLLTSYATAGVPPAIAAAAAAAVPAARGPGFERPGMDRGGFGERRTGGFERRPRYERRDGDDGAAAAADDAGSEQFRGKEGVVTRWTPHQHWGLITYDGVSTAFMPETQVPADQRALLGVDAVVRFDGYATAKSQREGKLEARNVAVVTASPRPGAGAAHAPAGGAGSGERRGFSGEHRHGAAPAGDGRPAYGGGERGGFSGERRPYGDRAGRGERQPRSGPRERVAM